MLTFIFISYLVLFCIVPYTILCFCQKNECSLKKKYEQYSLHSSSDQSDLTINVTSSERPSLATWSEEAIYPLSTWEFSFNYLQKHLSLWYFSTSGLMLHSLAHLFIIFNITSAPKWVTLANALPFSALRTFSFPLPQPHPPTITPNSIHYLILLFHLLKSPMKMTF